MYVHLLDLAQFAAVAALCCGAALSSYFLERPIRMLAARSAVALNAWLAGVFLSE